MRQELALKAVLVLVGLFFSAGIYPLIGSLLHPAGTDTGDTMMLSLYVTLGIFLLIAVRNPATHRSLIAFAAWSSFAHAVTMSIQGFEFPRFRARISGRIGCAGCYRCNADRAGPDQTETGAGVVDRCVGD
jgi:hypothetical protein